MDNHSEKERSYNMSQIKSTETKPEILVRKFLFARGLRYRKNSKLILGKPDIVLRKYNTVIFINGCFWHGHDNCKYFKPPKSNQQYWYPKIQRNKERDEHIYQKLKQDGWNVIVIWECELKKTKREKNLKELYSQIITSKIDKS